MVTLTSYILLITALALHRTAYTFRWCMEYLSDQLSSTYPHPNGALEWPYQRLRTIDLGGRDLFPEDLEALMQMIRQRRAGRDASSEAVPTTIKSVARVGRGSIEGAFDELQGLLGEENVSWCDQPMMRGVRALGGVHVVGSQP